MKHFIQKLIENPVLEDPFDSNLDVHKHFTRYSKGEFNGPAIQLSQTAKTLTIKGAYENEDENTRIALELVPDTILKVKGELMSGQDFTEMLKDFGFEDKIWYPKKSTGKTKKFQTKITTFVEVSKEKLMKLVTDGNAHFYSFLSFTSEYKKI